MGAATSAILTPPLLPLEAIAATPTTSDFSIIRYYLSRLKMQGRQIQHARPFIWRGLLTMALHGEDTDLQGDTLVRGIYPVTLCWEGPQTCQMNSASCQSDCPFRSTLVPSLHPFAAQGSQEEMMAPLHALSFIIISLSCITISTKVHIT